jgi:hypothetical protein
MTLLFALYYRLHCLYRQVASSSPPEDTRAAKEH